MAKRRSGFGSYLKNSHLLMPNQVAKYVLPLHMAVELLPLGLYQREHANHAAMVINLVRIDATGRSAEVYDMANEAAGTLSGIIARYTRTEKWGATSEELSALRKAALVMDKYMRTWTTNRLRVAAATADVLNEQAKARGAKTFEQVGYSADAHGRVALELKND